MIYYLICIKIWQTKKFMILMVCFVKSQCAINSLLSNFTNFISWHWKSVFCKTLRVYWLHSYYQLYLLALQIYFKKKQNLSVYYVLTYLLVSFKYPTNSQNILSFLISFEYWNLGIISRNWIANSKEFCPIVPSTLQFSPYH